jgi:hypothetical protein
LEKIEKHGPQAKYGERLRVSTKRGVVLQHHWAHTDVCTYLVTREPRCPSPIRISLPSGIPSSASLSCGCRSQPLAKLYTWRNQQCCTHRLCGEGRYQKKCYSGQNGGFLTNHSSGVLVGDVASSSCEMGRTDRAVVSTWSCVHLSHSKEGKGHQHLTPL